MFNQIVVALDNLSKEQALNLAKSISGSVWGYKINDLLVEHGCSIIEPLKKYGGVFADPKLHDIPNTVRNSVKRLSNAGADMITCHLSGGTKMLLEAKEAAGDAKIIGVSMLTSLSSEDIRKIYRGWPLERFVETINDSRIDGVVCASSDVPFWNMFNLMKVVPGVRPFGAVDDEDQVRTCDRHRLGAIMPEFLVIGRPITESDDPVESIARIKEILQ